MINGHAPNVAADTFCDPTGSAIQVHWIYQRHTQWQRTPRRLMLKRGRDADHLSPGHWKGDLQASSCNIKECWDEG
ncbi:hypothetical protein FA15DRAFT_734859, partial [Coprinopsis marcescibilis]